MQQNNLSRGIATNIVQRRTQRGYSAAELSRKTGLSKGTLSALETGTGNPTIDTLDAIAQALGIPLADLLAAPDVTPTTLAPPAPATGDAVQQDLIHRMPTASHVESWRLRMAPSSTFKGVPHAAHTQEQIILVSGELTAGPTSEPQHMNPGDSLIFDGSLPHTYVAGSEGAEAIVLLASPN